MTVDYKPTALDYRDVSAVMFGNQWHSVNVGSAFVDCHAYFVEGTYQASTKLIFKNKNGLFVVDLDDVQAYRFSARKERRSNRRARL